MYANSVDPDQTPSSAASDQGLHCLPMSLFWDARFIWVNYFTSMNIEDHIKKVVFADRVLYVFFM